ncbi:TIGR03067 domain-containing protein [Paludisphaera borealis]|uniref:TIGR03067 domain-containing protein n=1 Tax=Paludisphaera borealis TaxID=1387353 RepID=A0A1U7CP93_9BACT|nr:TIGR03067 domain-containing protein [Paludisphaera borealis]APW60760.1 hypothetical protein BSF38_02249 [Paludisphaera borealis]
MKLALMMVVAISGATWAVAGETQSTAGDLAKLQGKWEGRAGDAKAIRVTLDVTGTNVNVLVHTPQGLKIRAKGSLKLDESTTPRSLDWVKFSCSDQQELPEIAGIYKVENDAFTICNGGFNGARPSDFKPGDGPLADVLVFRRPATATAGKPSTGAALAKVERKDSKSSDH